MPAHTHTCTHMHIYCTTHSTHTAWDYSWDAGAGKGLILQWRGNHVVFLELRRNSRITTGNSVIKPVNLKGNQSWILLGRTDAEAPILWPPGVNSWLIGKDPDTGKDRRQKGKRATRDEMVGWLHQFNGPELEQTPGDGEEQGSLACFSPWGHKESTWLGNLTAKRTII